MSFGRLHQCESQPSLFTEAHMPADSLLPLPYVQETSVCLFKNVNQLCGGVIVRLCPWHQLGPILWVCSLLRTFSAKQYQGLRTSDVQKESSFNYCHPVKRKKGSAHSVVVCAHLRFLVSPVACHEPLVVCSPINSWTNRDELDPLDKLSCAWR